MNLRNNIEFEITAIALSVVLVMFLYLKGKRQTASNREFFRLVLFLLFGTIMDVAGAIDMSMGTALPNAVHVITNSLYFMMLVSSLFFLVRYTLAYLGLERPQLVRFNESVLIAYGILILANLPTGYLFSFDRNGVLVQGAMYTIIGYGFAFFFLCESGFLLFRHRSSMNTLQKRSLFLCVCIAMVSFLLQLFVFPELLITFFLGDLSMYVLFFVLETPAYHELELSLVRLAGVRAESEQTAETAREANRQKSEFLIGMSSRMRMPLKEILDTEEEILQSLGEQNMKKNARDIRDVTARLWNVVDEIHEYSLIENRSVEADNAHFDLHLMLEMVCGDARRAARSRGLRFVEDLDASLPDVIYGDERKLRHVLRNVLENAVRFTKKGLIRLRAFAEKAGEDILLTFEISDTGSGMSKEEHALYFGGTDDVTVAEVAGTSGHGAGLGLPISRHFLRIMKGTMTANSYPGKGTTVTIRLPFAASSLQALFTQTGFAAELTAVYIDREKGLAFSMGDEDLYANALETFAVQAERRAKELTAAFEQGDWERYRLRMQALKTAAQGIGATHLAEDARALEYACRRMRGEETEGYAPEDGESDAEFIKRRHARVLEHLRRCAGAAEDLLKLEKI